MCTFRLVAKSLSKNASAVLRNAEAEARARRQAVGTPHLLLGLLADEQAAPAHVLAAMGFSVGDVRDEACRVVGRSARKASRRRPAYSVRAEAILERAIREAQAEGRGAVEPADLLLAIVSEPEGKAAAILNALRTAAADSDVGDTVTAAN
ncbi:MAG: ATP-dependent Clp protease ATP-binding subunit ClpC [Actinomycetota bacterium]|jgi:ATP-dependent Clp protease ATP-binding subunit ClpA|nr:ATP-dependent Clp protease ATP-binding subunit ClpC [Actinomycetota bacterium]